MGIKWRRWALPAAPLALALLAATGCESSTPDAAPRPTAAPSTSASDVRGPGVRQARGRAGEGAGGRGDGRPRGGR